MLVKIRNEEKEIEVSTLPIAWEKQINRKVRMVELTEKQVTVGQPPLPYSSNAVLLVVSMPIKTSSRPRTHTPLTKPP